MHHKYKDSYTDWNLMHLFCPQDTKFFEWACKSQPALSFDFPLTALIWRHHGPHSGYYLRSRSVAQQHKCKQHLQLHAYHVTSNGQNHQHNYDNCLICDHGFTGMYHGGVQDQGDYSKFSFICELNVRRQSYANVNFSSSVSSIIWENLRGWLLQSWLSMA